MESCIGEVGRDEQPNRRQHARPDRRTARRPVRQRHLPDNLPGYPARSRRTRLTALVVARRRFDAYIDRSLSLFVSHEQGPPMASKISHPLEPLTADEVQLAVTLLKENRKVTVTTRFVSVSLHEPSKEAVRGFTRQAPPPRLALPQTACWVRGGMSRRSTKPRRSSCWGPPPLTTPRVGCANAGSRKAASGRPLLRRSRASRSRWSVASDSPR
jgi:Copper amine oxidase, N2 domain